MVYVVLLKLTLNLKRVSSKHIQVDNLQPKKSIFRNPPLSVILKV